MGLTANPVDKLFEVEALSDLHGFETKVANFISNLLLFPNHQNLYYYTKKILSLCMELPENSAPEYMHEGVNYYYFKKKSSVAMEKLPVEIYTIIYYLKLIVFVKCFLTITRFNYYYNSLLDRNPRAPSEGEMNYKRRINSLIKKNTTFLNMENVLKENNLCDVVSGAAFIAKLVTTLRGPAFFAMGLNSSPASLVRLMDKDRAVVAQKLIAERGKVPAGGFYNLAMTALLAHQTSCNEPQWFKDL